MGLVIALLARLGLAQDVARRWAPFAAAALALAALAGCYGGWRLWLHLHDHHVVAADRQAANLDALQGQATADAHAADQRVKDALANKDQEEAYGSAISSPAAGDSDDPGIRLACERLRRAGQDTTAIPQCGGR